MPSDCFFTKVVFCQWLTSGPREDPCTKLSILGEYAGGRELLCQQYIGS